MRTWSMVAVLVLASGCHVRVPYAVIVPEDADVECVNRCKSVDAIRGASEGMLCLADCGAEARANAYCAAQPEQGRCVQASVRRFSGGRTIGLIAGIVVAAVVVPVLAVALTPR